MKSALLVNIENLFAQKRDDEAFEKAMKLAFPIQLQWERESMAFRQGLQRTCLWEHVFSLTHPVTYERLKKSAARKSNAMNLLATIRINDTERNVWRGLLVLLDVSNRNDRVVWKPDPQQGGGDVAIHPADEFGVDCIHFSNNFTLRTTQLQRGAVKAHTTVIDLTSLTAASTLKRTVVMKPVQTWSVPFQDAAIILLQNVETGHGELVWIPTAKSSSSKEPIDASFFALNHNSFAEDPGDFRAPPFLLGDETLLNQQVVISSTEGRTDLGHQVKTSVAAVTIRQRDVLLFDQIEQTAAMRGLPHWRQLVTGELFEPRRIPLTASCFVLDGFLLYASADGVLRAHPRNNPQSTYHVEKLDSLVTHMVSLYNVVALVYAYNMLEVRLVAKRGEDPFIHFPRVLYRMQGIDPEYAPLLYGPYCIYKTMDGSWYRVQYDSVVNIGRELIKVPFKAGWRLVSIKNANFRYWIAVMRNPTTHLLQEFFLFVGGSIGDSGPRPFLMAACIECGIEATHVCSTCLEAGFCKKHASIALLGTKTTHSHQCTFS